MPHRGFRLVRSSDLEIRGDASWLFIAALLIYGLGRTAFPGSAPGLGNVQYLTAAVVTVLAFFGGLLLHECAHALVARRFGLKSGVVTLFVFGGIADLMEAPHDPRSEFWIAVVGPLATLALVGACVGLSKALGTTPDVLLARVALDHLAMLNTTLLVFNLVPAYPLDGGRLLRAAIWQVNADRFRATMIAAALGILFAWVLLFMGILSLFTSGDALGLWSILIGMLLLNVAQAARSDAQLHKHLGGRTVASVMTPHPVTVGPEASLSEVVDAIILERGRSFVPVVAQGRLVGVVTAEAIRRTSRDLWPTTRIRQVMEPLGPENTIEPDAASDMVLHHMARTGRHKLVVARQGVLVGVVTVGDLLNYLGIVQLFKDRLPDSKTKLLRRRANGIHEHPLSRMIHPKCKILSADRLL